MPSTISWLKRQLEGRNIDNVCVALVCTILDNLDGQSYSPRQDCGASSVDQQTIDDGGERDWIDSVDLLTLRFCLSQASLLLVFLGHGESHYWISSTVMPSRYGHQYHTIGNQQAFEPTGDIRSLICEPQRREKVCSVQRQSIDRSSR